MAVYFIQAGEGGPVKIGSTRNFARRLAGLQTSAPTSLIVLGIYEGDAEIEAALHRRLAAHRLRGEWFEATPSVLDAMREMTPATTPARGRGRHDFSAESRNRMSEAVRAKWRDDPEWAAMRRAQMRQNGASLGLLAQERAARYWLDVVARCHGYGRKFADRHIAIIAERTGMSAAEVERILVEQPRVSIARGQHLASPPAAQSAA